MATASGIQLITSQELNNPVVGTGDLNLSSGEFYAPSGEALPTPESSGQFFLDFTGNSAAIYDGENWKYLGLA